VACAVDVGAAVAVVALVVSGVGVCAVKVMGYFLNMR
jgi:hypothetical protein